MLVSWFHPASASLEGCDKSDPYIVVSAKDIIHQTRTERRDARREGAYATANGVETYTLLTLCRHMRGILFLLTGALSAADTSSLYITGKEHVSCMPYEIFAITIITQYELPVNSLRFHNITHTAFLLHLYYTHEMLRQSLYKQG